MPGQNQSSNKAIISEALAFGKYIVGRPPVGEAVTLYETAMHSAPALSLQEQKLLNFMLNHPWSIGCLDGAMVFTDPHGELRRRLYIMFAILEATPEYADSFLPRQRNPLYFIVIGLVGLRAVLRTLLGMVIVKAVR